MAYENNGKPESQENQPSDEPRLDQEQYDRLIECSKKGPEGIEQWNEWRANNLSEEIWLQGAYLRYAELQGANLGFAKLQGADLMAAELQGADLLLAKLQGAKLQQAELQGAKLRMAKLQGADLHHAKLQEADLWSANLQRAKLTGAIVDGTTSFLGCGFDENTDFRNTGLENARIEPGTKTRLKESIRRMNWRDWYWGTRNHKVYDKKDKNPKTRMCRVLWRLLKTSPVRLFWSMSDYGSSLGRIACWFFVLALLFACLYYFSKDTTFFRGFGDAPGLVEGLTEVDGEAVPAWLVPVRAVYFSIVTMTTLGFGDMYANARSFWGHVLLVIQVMLGYVLLGALITRLAILFISDGPAGKFTKMDEETKKLLAKLKKTKQ